MAADTLVILTGASRGLGQAMAAQYLAGGAFVLGLSRRESNALKPSGAGGWSNGRPTWPTRCRWPNAWARGSAISNVVPAAGCHRGCA